MTSATESIIEVAGRRLNPAVSPEWQHLLTHFELSEGFSFIVLLVPDSDWAQACRIALSRYFEVEGKGLLMVDYEDAEDFKVNLASRLLELHISYRTGAVWIEATVSEASSKYHEWVDAWRGMSARLNQFRNPLRSKIDIPLLFVGAHWIQPAIRDIAPDLWSVRTMVTRLEPPTEGGSASATWADVASEKQLEGQAIDPDFALKTAKRLRGQEGKELAIAQLLYRAGLGLIARSRWPEAEQVLREAIHLLRSFEGSQERLADSLWALGNSLEWQYKLDEADEIAKEARSVYKKVGDLVGEANCIQQRGDIAFRRSDHTTAQACYEEALSFYRSAEDVVSQADCIWSLGNIALRQSDHATAEERYDEALRLYRQGGTVLGEANSIKGLGNIALERSDHATAQARYEEALALFRRIGDVLGEANCIVSLGQIALERSDYAVAEARYEEALPLFRSIGSVLGEANCIQSIGDAALQEGKLDEARERFIKAQQLYERIAEPYSNGWSHVRLARLTNDTITRDKHLKAARAAWASIGRSDLIKDLDDEFNITEGKDATNS